MCGPGLPNDMRVCTHTSSASLPTSFSRNGTMLSSASATSQDHRLLQESRGIHASVTSAPFNTTLKQLTQNNLPMPSDEELYKMVPRLFRVDAPTTKLIASPFEDLFILRAAVSDFEDVLRRLARGQNVNALHSVRLHVCIIFFLYRTWYMCSIFTTVPYTRLLTRAKPRW